jgi:hypothetical protein
MWWIEAGLLTCSSPGKPSRPEGQWREVVPEIAARKTAELTASGNVRDFHPVPFSSCNWQETLICRKSIKNAKQNCFLVPYS